jgi:predicted ABC-type ATPase
VTQKRLRIFAGPNGSGKSSLLKIIPQSIPLGYYINADEIESCILSNEGVDLKNFGVYADFNTLHRFLKKSDFVKNKSDIKGLLRIFGVSDNIIKSNNSHLLPKYSAAIISDFIREENLKSGNDFSFETVMSHPEKLEFLKRAVLKGYHVYLYFISTDDVRVNIARVKTRVKNGGHNVPEDKIKARYYRSLDLLYDALKICYKSYLFDNSYNTFEVARIDRDKMMYISVAKEKIPNWMIEYVIKKS